MSQDPNAQSLPFLTRDHLRFETGAAFSLLINWTANVNTVIKILGFTREGPFVYEIVTGTGLQTGSDTFALPDFPISMTIVNNQTGSNIGGTYVEAFLRIATDRHILLCQGHISNDYGLSWPSQPHPTELQKFGLFNELQGTNPAAGVEISDSTIARAWSELISVSFTLVTSATAASRRVHLRIEGANSSLVDIPAPADQTASQTVIYTFMQGADSVNDATGLRMLVPLPKGLWLPPSTEIDTVTTNKQSGDNFGSANYVLRQLMGNFS